MVRLLLWEDLEPLLEDVAFERCLRRWQGSRWWVRRSAQAATRTQPRQPPLAVAEAGSPAHGGFRGGPASWLLPSVCSQGRGGKCLRLPLPVRTRVPLCAHPRDPPEASRCQHVGLGGSDIRSLMEGSGLWREGVAGTEVAVPKARSGRAQGPPAAGRGEQQGARPGKAGGPRGQKGRCDSGGRWDRPVDCGGARGVLGPWGVRASSVTLRPPPPAPRCLSAAPNARSPRCAAPLTPSGPGGVTGRGGAPVPRPPPQPQPAFPPQCLASATEGVRLAARIVDTPCNEMNTDTFLEVRGPGGRAGGAEPGRAGGR